MITPCKTCPHSEEFTDVEGKKLRCRRNPPTSVPVMTQPKNVVVGRSGPELHFLCVFPACPPDDFGCGEHPLRIYEEEEVQ